MAKRNKVIEFRNPHDPWIASPKHLDVHWEGAEDGEDVEVEWSEHCFQHNFEPPSKRDIDEENMLMSRRQRLFRWAAQSVALAMSELPAVQKVAVFGAVAQPLEMEVPRFREFRRSGTEVLHECGDLDMAVWTTDLSGLKQLKDAMRLGLRLVQNTAYGGVAHHQVDVHILDAASLDYRGRLCIFGQCPKEGKRECQVRDCGVQPFLQQFENYRFNPAQFEREPKTILFDRASGFLVHPPVIKADA